MCTPVGKPVPFSLQVVLYEHFDEKDCAPQLANLFLFHYEYSYMNILMKKNLCVAKMFNDTISYIDDLLTVNNSKFEKDRDM